MKLRLLKIGGVLFYNLVKEIDLIFIVESKSHQKNTSMNREELILTYTDFSDEQLIEAYRNPNDYSEEAKAALAIVIQKRGGIDCLLEKEQQQYVLAVETERIKQQVRRLNTSNTDLDFLSKMIVSQLLDEHQTRTIIQQTVEEINQNREDRQIKPRTIIGGMLGAVIAGIAGGIPWGLQIMWSGRIFVIFLVGLILLCYGIIRLFTRQSYKNTAVFVLTAIAVVIALFIGQLMFEIFGRQ